MNRVLVVGPSGAGKSELSRKLHKKLQIPLYHLDNIFWKEDKTHISREDFDKKLDEILKTDKWIIDGDYSRTYEVRIKAADTVLLLYYPLDVCLSGAQSRVGKVREDFPWVDDEFDQDFKEWIINWFDDKLPVLKNLLEEYKDTKEIHVFKSREEGDKFIENL